MRQKYTDINNAINFGRELPELKNTFSNVVLAGYKMNKKISCPSIHKGEMDREK